MSFNKRYISKSNLESLRTQKLDFLVKFILRPDCLIIQDSFSQNICDIVKSTSDISLLNQKLIEVGFYESK